MMSVRNLVTGCLTVIAAHILAPSALACPFCSAVARTFSEDFEAMDVVVVARLVKSAPVSSDPDAELVKSKFRIEQVLKGENWAKADEIVEVLYFGDADKQKRFLMMGTDPPNTMWSSPLSLTDRAYEYVLQLPDLPKDASRLEFFQEYLEDDDELLARDAYDEFAKIPYAGVTALKEKMHHDRLVKWIKDPDVPASRRRLYFTMLGVCGSADDAPMLESMMRSSDRSQKAGLDALIACFLIVKGADGLPLVDELFLKNTSAEYADTYSAIMAIRFHGTESNVIPHERLVQSLRHMLDRPDLADLVIPDLAKWEDWQVMPRLVQLFKDADDKSSWVRVPVINYLRACPLPEAKAYIEELSKIDAEAVKRAHTFFPFTPDQSDQQNNPPAKIESSFVPPSDQEWIAQPLPPPDAKLEPANLPSEAAARAAAVDHTTGPFQTVTVSRPAEHMVLGSDTVPGADAGWRPNTFQLVGVPMLGGMVLMAVMRCTLGLPLIRARS